MPLVSNDDLLKKMNELETKLDRLIFKDNIDEFEEFTEGEVSRMTGWSKDRVRMYCETGQLKARKEICKRAGKKRVIYFIKRHHLREFQEQQQPEVKQARAITDMIAPETTEQFFKKIFKIA